MIRHLRRALRWANQQRNRRLRREAGDFWAQLQTDYPDLPLAICPDCPNTAFLSQAALNEHLHARHGDS